MQLWEWLSLWEGDFAVVIRVISLEAEVIYLMCFSDYMKRKKNDIMILRCSD